MSFADLGLSTQLLNCVAQLGYTEATPIQKAAIPVVLSGKDLMAGAQTGTGKTAAFALPIIQQLSAQNVDGHKLRALVLTPTRELALQVFNSFERYGEFSQLKAALVYGGASINTQMTQLSEGVDILVATPGRLLDLIGREAVDLTQLESLVLDEADRMLDMGFVVDIKRIIKKLPSGYQSLLFSATFGPEVFELSKSLLKEPELIEVDQRNTAATEVEQRVYAVDPDRKRELISYLIGSQNWKQVLIFTRTKQGADLLAKELCKDGLKSEALHGDKSQGARERGLEKFKNGSVRVLVATDVAARGLDIDSLQYVVNFELPYNAEDYIHRIGRTGRAGSAGLAVTLLSEEETYLLEQVEELLDHRLAQQWLPGYEPDLTREVKSLRNSGHNSNGKQRGQGNNKDRRRRRR